MKNLKEEIIKLLDTKLAEDIDIVDFKTSSTIFDLFIICSARNIRHAYSLANEVEDLAYKNNVKIYSSSINQDSPWQLIDLGDIVVHIFVNEERAKYNLEGLWKDLLI